MKWKSDILLLSKARDKTYYLKNLNFSAEQSHRGNTLLTVTMPIVEHISPQKQKCKLKTPGHEKASFRRIRCPAISYFLCFNTWPCRSC